METLLHRLTGSDKVYQLLAHGRWFSLASSTTKTGRHDIAEILLKVALKQKKNPNHINVHHTVSKSTCNKYCRARTHAVLVVGIYELLGNLTT
jgi:hypothetical protein